MADIRSMLRNELASRGSSTQSGSTGRVTKKRKIEEPDTIQPAHKRSRPTSPSYTKDDDKLFESANVDQEIAEEDEEEDISQNEEAGPNLPDDELPQQETNSIISNRAQITASDQKVDEDEWAAFEREVVAPTRAAPVPAAVAASSAATISAAPVTADELAAQQQKQKEEQARVREEDIEGEKEDAARHLEEEFEEMEQLEERVKRLKAKREELRTQNVVESNGAAVDAQETSLQDGEGSEDEDDEDEDWDDWRFR
jgi:hypothetical protein